MATFSDDALQRWMALDPETPEGAARLGRERREVLVVVDLLAGEGRTGEACELGLHLEQALGELGEPVQGEGWSRWALVEHLLGIARAAGSGHYQGEMLLRQAELCLEEDGDDERAAALFSAARDLAQREGLRLLEVMALGGLAGLAQGQGNVFLAHSLHGKQREAAEALGEPAVLAQVLGSLAATALAMNDFRRGARYAREHLAAARDLGDEGAMANALCSLGLAQRHLGEIAEGTKSYEEALLLARKEGLGGMEAMVLYNLGCLLAETDPGRARGVLGEARALARRLGIEQLIAGCERALAQLADRPR